jgi:membrane protease YdiL (CAAX protease family)
MQSKTIGERSSAHPSFVKRYQVPLFFILAFTLSWFVWGSYIAEQQGLIPFHLPEASFAYFALTLAVIIMAWAVGGRTEITEIFSHILRWRVGIQWYVVAILTPIFLTLVAAVTYQVRSRHNTVGADMTLGAAVIYAFTFGAKAWITEEVAWRGFVLPRLQARYGAVIAGLILGVMWGLWHTPLFFINGTGQSHWPYLGFIIFAVAESVLITWVYNKSHQSVLLTAIFHAVTDAALAYSGLITANHDAFWVTVVIYVLAAIVVVVLL